MRHPRVLRPLIGALAAVSLMAFAPSASAGTIRYDVRESARYDVQDNGRGIVKVTYRGCVVADVRQTLEFRIRTRVSEDSNATFNVLREEGENPNATFDPASVFLEEGEEQTFDVKLSFTVSEENNDKTTFRIKLDPESGEGLGEGAGVMVTIPCVIAASTIPPPSSPTAREDAPCITVRRVRLRVGQRKTVVVTVRRNGEAVQGARVRLRGAGLAVSKRSGASGRARFRVRPTRRGTVVIQTNVCAGADRLRVFSAVAPRFTG